MYRHVSRSHSKKRSSCMFIAPLGISLQCKTGNITLIMRKISVMGKNMTVIFLCLIFWVVLPAFVEITYHQKKLVLYFTMATTYISFLKAWVLFGSFQTPQGCFELTGLPEKWQVKYRPFLSSFDFIKVIINRTIRCALEAKRDREI